MFVILILIIIATLRRKLLGAPVFIALLFSGFFYAFGSTFEISSLTVKELHFWLSVEYLGIASIGPLWLILARTLTDKMRPDSKKLLPLYFILPVLIVLSIATNNYHNLFYSSLSISHSGPFTIPITGKGPLYWVNMIYMNVTIFIGTLLSCINLIRSPKAYRKQAGILFLASIVPWLGMFMYQLGLSPYHLDIAPLGFTLSVMLYAWGMFRHKLFDFSPIVHENVFVGMKDGVLVYDTKCRLLGANPAIQAILHELSFDRVGEDIHDILKNHQRILSILKDKKEQTAELSIFVDGCIKYYEITVGDMKDSRGNLLGTILSMTDISTQAELLELLREQATIDQLTGIRNRRSFFETAKNEIERARRNQKPLALIMLDLDNFKMLNDTFGHLAGDEILKKCTQLCIEELRASDVFGRFGGEEFVALLPDTGIKEALRIAERLRIRIKQTELLFNDKTVSPSASFGVSARQAVTDLSIETIIHEADTALYQAKADGRNKVMCYSGEC